MAEVVGYMGVDLDRKKVSVKGSFLDVVQTSLQDAENLSKGVLTQPKRRNISHSVRSTLL